MNNIFCASKYDFDQSQQLININIINIKRLNIINNVITSYVQRSCDIRIRPIVTQMRHDFTTLSTCNYCRKTRWYHVVRVIRVCLPTLSMSRMIAAVRVHVQVKYV